jgi:hypothetical protein
VQFKWRENKEEYKKWVGERLKAPTELFENQIELFSRWNKQVTLGKIFSLLPLGTRFSIWGSLPTWFFLLFWGFSFGMQHFKCKFSIWA